MGHMNTCHWKAAHRELGIEQKPQEHTRRISASRSARHSMIFSVPLRRSTTETEKKKKRSMAKRSTKRMKVKRNRTMIPTTNQVLPQRLMERSLSRHNRVASSIDSTPYANKTSSELFSNYTETLDILRMPSLPGSSRVRLQHQNSLRLHGFMNVQSAINTRGQAVSRYHPKSSSFNERVQADTMWITPPQSKKAFPILMMSDSLTRLISARLLVTEDSDEFIKSIEKGWIRSFGPMKGLQVDEHRAWSSEKVRNWCSENGIELSISPGQSHTRLAILERRHQVTRRALMIFMMDNPNSELPLRDYVVRALNYVIPQINRHPNVRGYSPVQWTLGYTPHVPGLLMEEETGNNPSQLDPSQQFMEKLRLQQSALKAMSEADLDRRIRRALLRKFTGQVRILNTGDKCYYWRDAPAGAATKLRWKGPAIVVMREASSHGPHADVYWLAHGTVLLRAAPEHVKPADPRPAQVESGTPLDRAKDALQGIRGRGVTQFIDLPKSNKRRRAEVDSDEEEEQLDIPPMEVDALPQPPILQDEWSSSPDGHHWTRYHRVPRTAMYVPEPTNGVPVAMFEPERVTDLHKVGPSPEHVRLRDDWRAEDASRQMHYEWIGTTTFKVTQQVLSDDSEIDRLFDSGEPSADEDDHDDGNGGGGFPPTINVSMTEGAAETGGQEDDGSFSPPEGQMTYSQPEGTGILHTVPGLETDAPMPESTATLPDDPETTTHEDGELSMQGQPVAGDKVPPGGPTVATQATTIPEVQREVYEPKPGESFQEQRARVEKQETLLFDPRHYGPARGTTSRSTPYSRVPEENLMQTSIEVDILQNSKLPGGWRIENGFLQLEEPRDDWIIHDNYLTRRHFIPRKDGFVPNDENCPVPTRYLKKDRITQVCGHLVRDKWTRSSRNKKLEECLWTGYTRFKIHTTWRPKATEEFFHVSEGFETAYYEGASPTGPVNEKYMTTADRRAFYEAKQKELESFFHNQVWHFDQMANAEASRVLRARFLLNWKKNSDGTPRAKARLVVQGFKDPDALSGSLSTASPTLTRLSRNFVLTIAAMMNYQPFTADITTAFFCRARSFHRALTESSGLSCPRMERRFWG